MKNIFVIICFLVCFQGFSQGALTFSYDDAGNQIDRSIVFYRMAKPDKEVFKSFDKSDNFTYYPNPVNEILILKWENTSEKKINTLNVYSINGNLLKTYQNLNALSSHELQFSEYAQGVYIVSLGYTNGEEKTIKIVKE